MKDLSLEKVLYDDGLVKIILDDSAVFSQCVYPVTNEPYSINSYTQAADTGTVVGIIGGGEQLLDCARNPKVKEIIGIDINTSQVALCAAKITLAYGERKCSLMDAAKKMWRDRIDLKKRLDDYRECSVYSYGFSSIYDNLKQRMEKGDLKLTLIASDLTKVLPCLKSDDTTVYLSNVPDCINDLGQLYDSLGNFLKSKSKIVLCELSSDDYDGTVGVFSDMIVAKNKYRRHKTNTFVGSGSTLDETVYVMSP